MIDIKGLFNDHMITESGAAGHMKHIFEDGDLTFADIRDIMTKVFSGDIMLEEKIDGVNVFITYKDGQFCVARNKKTLEKPMPYEKLTAEYVDSPKEVRDAFANSVSDLASALSSLDQIQLNRFFANGKNFLNCEIVYPPCANVIDYGNKCFIVLHGIKCYDDTFTEVGEDRESAEPIVKMLAASGAIQQEMFEITKPNVLRIKDTVLAKDVLEKILGRLNQFIDGVGWKCSLNQFIQDKYSRHIVNKALEHGIDVSRGSEFVKALSQRLSKVSGKKPTKPDLVTYAKCDGVDYRTDAYKAFLSELEDNADATNTEIIRPVEDLIVYAGLCLMKNLVGFMAADPSKTAKKILAQVDDTIMQVKEGEFDLSPEKIARFKKNLAKLEQYHEAMPTEGVVIRYHGRVYKLTATFGAINQLVNIIKYR